MPPEAVKVCVPPVAIVTVDGDTAIAAELIVTVAVPVLPDESVAITVTVPAAVPAVKAPVVESIEAREVLLKDQE